MSKSSLAQPRKNRKPLTEGQIEALFHVCPKLWVQSLLNSVGKLVALGLVESRKRRAWSLFGPAQIVVIDEYRLTAAGVRVKQAAIRAARAAARKEADH